MNAPPPPIKCPECQRLLAASVTSCPHCGTITTIKRRPDPIHEALVTLMGCVLEIKGNWTESIDSAMQQAEKALGGPDHAALMRLADTEYTCEQRLEFARDFLDSAVIELQEANQTASGLASLLLLDMIEKSCVMSARIRAILNAVTVKDEHQGTPPGVLSGRRGKGGPGTEAP